MEPVGGSRRVGRVWRRADRAVRTCRTVCCVVCTRLRIRDAGQREKKKAHSKYGQQRHCLEATVHHLAQQAQQACDKAQQARSLCADEEKSRYEVERR